MSKPLRFPWQYGQVEKEAIFALQAVAQGVANETQQRRAIEFIISDLCESNRMSFYPGDEGRRATDFAEGKRWVGLQIARILKIRPKMEAST